MKNEKQNRREFFKLSAAGIAAISLIKDANASEVLSFETNFELTETTIGELQTKMKASEVSSRKLVEMYLQRIKEIDPKINSVIEINPDALKIADEMDKERKKGKLRGMMHGIPVLIKDNIDTADKMKTTAGSFALARRADTERRCVFGAAIAKIRCGNFG